MKAKITRETVGMEVETVETTKRLFAPVLLLFLSLFTLISLAPAHGANSSSITRLVITENAVFRISSSTFSTQPEITVADSSSRAVRDSGNTISASITSGSGGSLVGTTTATTNGSGKASFNNLGITGNAGVTYTITYSYRTFSVSENISIPLAAALTPTFGTYTRTASGFTVVISNYNTAYTWTGTATNGGSVAFSGTNNNGLATITGLAANTSSVATINTARTGYNNGSANTSSTSSLAAALTPTFGTYTQTSTGFTVQISNYSNSYNWSGTATNGGTVSISNSGLVTVSGLSAGESSVATISTTRSGYVSGSADTESTAALRVALTPTFGTYTRTATGFTVVITNYDTAYTWTGTATRSGTVSFSGTNNNGLATITGVAANTASVATINTARSGYQSGSANTSSTTSLSAGLTPNTATPSSTFGGFTFNVTNYNSAYTYSLSSTAGSASAGTATGSTLPITVTGLSSGQNVTVTITTNRSGYASASNTRTGSAKTSDLTPTSGNPGAWNSSAISDDGQYVVFAGTDSKLFVSPNAGTDWTSVGSTREWTSVAVSSDGSKMIAGASNSKLRYSSDSGSSWKLKGSSANWRAVAMSSDGSKLYGAVQNGFIFKSTNAGSTWTQQGTTENWRALASSQDGQTLVAAVNQGTLYTTTNGGTTWTSRDEKRNWSAVSISDDGSVMTATVSGGGIYVSTNTGQTWSALAGIDSNTWNSISCNSTCSTFAVTSRAGNLYLLTRLGVKSVDASNTTKWSTVSLNSAGTQVIAGATTGVIRRSVDAGATWSHRTRIQE